MFYERHVAQRLTRPPLTSPTSQPMILSHALHFPDDHRATLRDERKPFIDGGRPGRPHTSPIRRDDGPAVGQDRSGPGGHHVIPKSEVRNA